MSSVCIAIKEAYSIAIKSISTETKSKSNNNIKLSVIICLAFLSRMICIVPFMTIMYIIYKTFLEQDVVRWLVTH